MWVYIAVINSNILVAKVMGGYFACFVWPQRQGSIEPNKGSTKNRSLLMANHSSVFILSIV